MLHVWYRSLYFSHFFLDHWVVLLWKAILKWWKREESNLIFYKFSFDSLIVGCLKILNIKFEFVKRLDWVCNSVFNVVNAIINESSLLLMFKQSFILKLWFNDRVLYLFNSSVKIKFWFFNFIPTFLMFLMHWRNFTFGTKIN